MLHRIYTLVNELAQNLVKTLELTRTSAQEKAMNDEEFVRSVWKLTAQCDGSYRSYPRGTVLVQEVRDHWVDFESWPAAAEFTRNRLEEIRQVEEEIYDLNGSDTPPVSLERILAREQAALTELKRGMR